MSKATELIKSELGSELRHLDPKRRLLPPPHKGLFHISTASSGSLADDEQEKLKTLPGGREVTGQHPCGCWWEGEKPCPLVSLFHGEALMPNATQMEVFVEAVPLPTPDRRLWSIRPQATQATKTQPKAEQTQTLSPPEAAVFPSICPRGVGQGWGRMSGEGAGEWTRKWECAVGVLCSSWRNCLEMGKGTSFELDRLLIRGPACFQISPIFWFHLHIL